MVGIVEFKNTVDFKNGYLATVKLPLKKEVTVHIQYITKDFPKSKTMPLSEFRRVFNITHIKTIVGYDCESYKRRAFFNKYLLIAMKWLRLA